MVALNVWMHDMFGNSPLIKSGARKGWTGLQGVANLDILDVGLLRIKKISGSDDARTELHALHCNR